MRVLPWLLVGCVVPLLAQQPPQPAAPKDGTSLPFNVIAPASTIVDPNTVVLQVGDIKITAQQLDALIDVYPESTRVFARGPGREQFADSVIRMLVLSEEARKRKLGETEKFKEQLRFSEANLLSSTLTEMLPAEVVADDDALRKYYEQHRCEYANWKARHVLIRTKGSPLPVRAGQPDLSDDEALMRARQLRQRLVDGADFAAMAKSDSDDNGSAANGGDMGEIRHGQIVPTLEDAICKMTPGELSDPIKTPFGYHVIRLESNDGKDFGALKPILEQKYRAEMAKKAIDEMVAKTKVVKDKEYYAPPVLSNIEPKKP
jgi:peptidyl-prolyl cis-trans isomerase C